MRARPGDTVVLVSAGTNLAQSEFQETLVQLADILGREPRELEAIPRAVVADEEQASVHVQAQITEFLR